MSSRRAVLAGRTIAGMAIVAAAVTTSVVVAIEDAALEIDEVSGEGWSAHGLVMRFQLPQQRTQAHLSVERLQLASFSQQLRDVRIDCPQLELSAAAIACKQARVTADWPGIGSQKLRASVVYGRNDGSLDVRLDGIRLGQGTAEIQGSLRDGGWTARARLNRAPVELLMKLAADLEMPLPSLSATGLVTLAAHASGSPGVLRQARVSAQTLDLTANNESGSLATDKLSFDMEAALRRSAGDWAFEAEVRSHQGQAYAEPIFLDLGTHGLTLSAAGKLGGNGALSVDRFDLDHAEVAQASGRAVLDLEHEQPLRSLSLQLAKLSFPGAYHSYFQPLLLDTNFKSMQTGGSIEGRLMIEQGAAQLLDLRLDDVSFDDGAGNFALTALQGRLHWLAEDTADGGDDESDADARPAPRSDLRWRDGALFGLALGASDLAFATRGRQFRLLEPARIPLLDGAIDLESFRIRNAGTPKVAFMVDATLQPVSVERLCAVFGWPEFGGSIGGVISKLRMREGVVTLGTTLQAQVFNGGVTIRDLRLEQPFGQWPRFYSSIALDDLDLELVTGAFSFGRITGRLSGAIDGLQLFNWTPVAFDARLYTPPDDRSRHRISQRAVENIGSIGGGGAGVTAALSSGFLRFFEDFNYDRLGISCRLENEICQMGGVAPAPNGGYYLVRGKGLPRIDVIGNARRVDWPRLVQQLIAATESEGVVVE